MVSPSSRSRRRYDYQPLGIVNQQSLRSWRKIILVIGIALILETWYHIHSLRVTPPTAEDSDKSFQIGCSIPNISAPRANATILMLTRNADVEGALLAITSLERHFNRWYKYPIVFLNNEPFSQTFIDRLSKATTGPTTFEVIPEEMWSFPKGMDVDAARASIKYQDGLVGSHSGREGYHHMCRFYSGFFYDHPAMQKYKWFWRVEPDVEYTCAITYDPFIEMEKHGKVYGYTIALWEVGMTVPSLFALVDEYRRQYLSGHSTEVWKAMLDAAWVPWPFRRLFNLMAHHTKTGDYWNFCHYWSNFEIADMDFFRADAYRKFFDYLDQSGGFYFERFGDAPIHSFAAALLLDPKQIHHFEDMGYRHNDLWAQPNNAANKQIPRADFTEYMDWAEERLNGIGCRCENSKWKARTDFEVTNVDKTCFRKLARPIRAPG